MDSSIRLIVIILSVSTLLAGCYSSTATLSSNHPTKNWNLTVPIESESSSGSERTTPGKETKKHVPFWVPGDREGNPKSLSQFPISHESASHHSLRDNKVEVERLTAIDPPRSPDTDTPKDLEVRPTLGHETKKNFLLEKHIGRARVIDGDVLEIGGEVIRLEGIDAPERTQECRSAVGVRYNCGLVAVEGLTTLTKGKELTCVGTRRDADDSLIAKCFSGDTDINEIMVSKGFALAYPQYSIDYVSAENTARSQSAGLWGGEFLPPWEWRQGKR